MWTGILCDGIMTYLSKSKFCEVKKLSQLREQFERTATVLNELLEKIKQGIFLSQEDQATLHDTVDALYQEQVRTRTLLGENVKPVFSLQETELLLAQQKKKEQQHQQLRQLVKRFQSLRPLSTRYQSELEDFQTQLATCGDEELQRLDAEGGLEPYRRFLDCIQMEHPDYDKDIEPLIAFFGMALPLGIMGKKITLQDEGAIVQPEVVPILEKQMEPKVLPLAAEKQAEPKTLPPVTNLAALGVLKKHGSRKQPKGVKALLSMCAGSMELVQLLLEFLESQGSIALKHPIFRTETDMGPERRERLLESLTKEGYALRCNLEGSTEQVIYNCTETARQTFSKVVNKLVSKGSRNGGSGKKMKELPDDGTIRMEDAADFIRAFENRRGFSKIFDLRPLWGELYEKTGISFIRIARQDDTPTLALIFPVALFAEGDSESNLRELLDQLDTVAENAAPGCKVFLASVDQETCRGWGDYLRPHLPADAEIFCGSIGEDCYTNPDGSALSLSGYLQELHAQHSGEAKPAEETQSRQDLGGFPRQDALEPDRTEEIGGGEAVLSGSGEEKQRQVSELFAEKSHEPAPAIREHETTATCTAEGSYEEVIRCKDCGEELSRETRIIPRKPHSAGKPVRTVLFEPTCEAEGSYEEVVRCKDCGEEMDRNQGLLPRTDHTPCSIMRENIMEASASEPGSYEEVICCSVCGKELSRRVKTIPALGTLEEKHLSEMQQNMYRLFTKEDFPSALTMSRALGMQNSQLHEEYLQYAYAYDDPAYLKHYCYSELQSIFSGGFGQKLSTDALGLAAHLQLFFSNAAAAESYYLRDIMSPLEQNLMFQKVPDLKNVFYDLENCYTRTNRLLDAETMSILVDDERNGSLREQYQREAKRFLARKPDEPQQMNRRVNGTFRNLFGTRRPLRTAIEWVADGDETRTEEIQNILKPFLKPETVLTGICEEKHLDLDSIEQYVEDSWNSTRDKVSRNRNENFRDPARATAIDRVVELIKLSLSWTALNGSSTDMSDEDWSFLDTQRRKISTKMKETAELCVNCQTGLAEDQAAFHTLTATLRRMSDYLLGGCFLNEQRYFYLEFLRDNRIEVDENYIPYLENEFEEIAPLNLCKRILKHSEATLPEWPEVIKRIFEEPEDGCDFGHARLIKNYFLSVGEELNWPMNYSFEQSIEFTCQRIDEEGRKFQAQLDLAENYGWVDDTSRIDRILADMEKRREHYLSTNNFGFYFRTTEACKEALKREAEQHRAGYEVELSRLRAEKGSWPIFDEVQHLISKQMYTVAQDYMDQARTGQQEAPSSSYLAQKDDVFGLYLKQYDRLLTYARDASERRITEVYSRHARSLDRGIARTGTRMLEHWPRSVSAGTLDALKELFMCMGLAVSQVEKQEYSQHYKVKLLRKGREVNYPHPIGAYGTVMQENGLHVFLTFGKRNDNAMNAELQRIMSTPLGELEPAIVLADTAIPLPERRSLAHKLKSQGKTSPYLLLDRVLLFYLAEFRQEERWNVLLRCTLPFHAYNPYTESSTVELCPEMFIGRQQELNSIVDSGGANIVYGGRQLGKTALLQRARKLRDIREDGQWAFYLDIRNRSVEETARLIYEMMLDDKFLSEPGGAEIENISWDQLTRKIIQRMNDERQPVKSVLLLLDEADTFLYNCGENGYSYEPIVSMKRIQSRTNRFKFVLAGLHNVMRFNKKVAQNDDSPIPHLASITMRPLPFHEARELIELPLSYLGFKVQPENDYLIVQILSSTNYFPGLIQYYCSSLVNAANQNYRGDTNERPPYWLEEAQILTLLKDKKFQENIKNKFEITLGVDEKEKGYYKTLACALAYCYFSNPENLTVGYSAENIRAICHQLDIHSIMELDRDQIAELLDELIDLNVLRSRFDGDETRYIFNRASFRHMLGNESEIDDELEKIMEKEANAYA